MKKPTLILLLQVLFAQPLFSGPLTDGLEVVEPYGRSLDGSAAQAWMAYEGGDFSGVIRLLDGSQRESDYGSMAEALRLAANIRLGRAEAAHTGWENLASSARLSVDAALLVSEAFMAEGEHSRAAAVLRRGLLNAPTSAELLRRLGLALANIGRHESALLYLEAALKQSKLAVPDGNALDALARSYLAIQQYQSAADVYGRFQSADGSLRGLADVHALLEKGRQDDALVAIRDISYPHAREFLFKARLLLLANRPDGAIEALSKVPASAAGSSVYSGTSLLAFLAAGRIKDASSLLQNLLQADALQDPVPAAIVAAAEGDVELARSYLRSAPLPLPELADVPAALVSISNESETKRLALAYYRYRLGFFELAREATEGVESPLPLLIAADSARRMKLSGASASEYATLMQRAPNAVSLRYQYALVLMESGDLTRANEVMKDVLDDRPDYIAAAISRASTQRQSGDLAGAIDTLSFSLNFQPKGVSLLVKLASYQIEAGDLDAAEGTLGILRRAEQSDSWSTSRIAGRLSLERGDAAKAKESFERAVAVRMDSPELLQDLARAYDALGADARASSVRILSDVLFN